MSNNNSYFMHLKYRLLFLFIPFVLASCDLETSDNGKLDGFWHLERVDTLATGGSFDMSSQKVFWSFNVKLLQLQGGASPLLCRFNQVEDSLILYSPYTNGGHEESLGEGGNKPLTDASVLRDYGIEDLETHYKKEALDGSRMVLRSRCLRLVFRKF